MAVEPGLRLGDRYTLEERIAVGGMGEVWRARDEVLGRPVAVKTLREDLAADPSFHARFRDEARHAAAFSHPGVANVHDYGEVEHTPYLVMELVDGEPLSTLLAREGPLAPERVLDIVGQTALALQAAHDAGIVHRDVKPGNLLVRRDGVVKVTDFGVARALDAAPVTQTGLVVGTAQYLSPEQASGHPATPASDVYALGVVAYQCLAGRPPFTGDGPVAVALAHVNQPPPPLGADVPPLVGDLVLAALAKRAGARPSSAGELGRTALALRDALTRDQPLAAPPVDPPQAADRPAGAPDPTRLLTAPVAAEAVVGSDPATVLRPAARRRPGWVNLAAVVAALAVIALLLVRGCAGGGSSGAAPAPSASSTPAKVQVVAADYLGKPYDVVRAALVAKDLRVQRATRAADAQADTVVGVGPTGLLTVGSTVTVTVATPPPAGGEGDGKDGKDGKGDKRKGGKDRGGGG